MCECPWLLVSIAAFKKSAKKVLVSHVILCILVAVYKGCHPTDNSGKHLPLGCGAGLVLLGDASSAKKT